MSDSWGDEFDSEGDDTYAEEEFDEQEFLEEAIEEIFEHLDETGSDGGWLVSITLDDGSEWEMHVPIEMVWEIRDFAMEYGLEFDYEYEG